MAIFLVTFSCKTLGRRETLLKFVSPHGTIQGRNQVPFEFSQNVNRKVYRDFLLEILSGILEDIVSANFHWAVGTLLYRTYPDSWICRGQPTAWPPCSPDLNHFDFYIKGHLKPQMYERGFVNDVNLLRFRYKYNRIRNQK